MTPDQRTALLALRDWLLTPAVVGYPDGITVSVRWPLAWDREALAAALDELLHGGANGD